MEPARVVRSEFCGWNCMVCPLCRRLAGGTRTARFRQRRARERPLMRIRSGIAAALTAICVTIAPAPSVQAAEPAVGRSDSVENEATRLCLCSDTDGHVHTAECRWNSPYRQGVPEVTTPWGTSRNVGYSRKARSDTGTPPRLGRPGHGGPPVPGRSVLPQLAHLSPSPRTTDVPARHHMRKYHRAKRHWAPRSSRWAGQACQVARSRPIGSQRVPSTVLGGVSCRSEGAGLTAEPTCRT